MPPPAAADLSRSNSHNNMRKDSLDSVQEEMPPAEGNVSAASSKTSIDITSSAPTTPTATAATTKWVKLHCPGKKLYIRGSPRIDGEVLGWMRSGETVQVRTDVEKGFFKLVDKPVRV
jgi:hypothetical protein